MTIRAVLFDFGGTLYDYATLEAAERESLVELARQLGINAEPGAIQHAHREAMRQVFRQYLPRRFYLHRNLFRDAVIGMLESFGVAPDAARLDRYRAAQWQRHARDFTLRDGVSATLATLRQRGVHLGIVSNIDDDQLAHLLEIAAIGSYFDSILSSEQVQSCKPDRTIFEKALERAGCAAGEALFVGDTLAQDIAGANRVGLQSVLLWHRTDRDPPDAEPRPRHVIRRIPDLLDLV
ncbi:MAG TPA: HAD family hydrolase [Candidatus Margulisiibacteriota bacterium]|nr:HAD family hydrolase [Candidatus Margulisiibacteriota bacterium]